MGEVRLMMILMESCWRVKLKFLFFPEENLMKSHW